MPLPPEYEDMLAMIEWEYTAGQSFSVGDDDVLRWMVEHGWTFQCPPGFQPTAFDDFPENFPFALPLGEEGTVNTGDD